MRFLCLLLTLVLLGGCSRSKDDLAFPGHPLKSPSGNYELVVLEMSNKPVVMWTFEVYDLREDTPKLSFRCDRDWSTLMKLFLTWGDEEDVVWVDSSDIGKKVYYLKEGAWVEEAAFRTHFKPPKALVERGRFDKR